MAGDWIKMRLDLADDPAVVGIAAKLDISEDEVVGKLHRLWGWADRHTTDGTAPGITAKWVNRYVSPGFAEAMQAVGWIDFTQDGVEFPGFDKHNGVSAKKRGEDAIRQRLSRENRDKGVTGLTRESIPKTFKSHVFERDGYRCVFCGTASSAELERSRKANLSIDHLIPTTRGGATKIPNLATACRACNGEKNDRTPEEWGMLPTFLNDGVTYSKDSGMSHEKCDEAVTREEKRREEVKRTTSLSADKLPPCPHQKVLALFAEKLPELPQPKPELWEGQRAKDLSARWKWLLTKTRQNGERYATTEAEALEWLGRYFGYVAASDFLSGRDGKWGNCDLSWLMKADNFAKVVQGNYENKAAA